MKRAPSSSGGQKPVQRDQPRTGPVSFWLAIIALSVLLVFALRICTYFVPAYYAGVDEASYFLTAKALVSSGSPAIHASDPLIFTPTNTIEVEPGLCYQKYPIGYPLLLAAGYWLAGDTGAFLVNPIFGVLCVLGTMLLAREILERGAALVTALALR